MPFFTPHGLKIRLPIDYSFALMQRVYPSISAYQVLLTTEYFDRIPQSLSFISAILCFIFQADLIWAVFLIASAHVIGHMYRISGLFVDQFFIKISRLYSFFAGWGLYFIIIAIVGFLLMGWKGPVAYILGRISALIVNGAIDYFNAKRMQRTAGIVVTTSEFDFLNSYRSFAHRFNKSLDLEVSDEELKEYSWHPTYNDLAEHYPHIVAQMNIF